MVWLAGIPGARETRLTPSKETCRLKQGNLPTEQGNLPTEIFYLRTAIQRTIDASPAFMEYGLAKKITA
jgi:hypothetical protein